MSFPHSVSCIGACSNRHKKNLTWCACCQVQYSYKVANFGCAYGDASSFQALSRRVRHTVQAGALVDWDINNSMFTLMTQLVARMGMALDIPDVRLPSWTAYAQDPDSWRRRVTAMGNGGRMSSSRLLTEVQFRWFLTAECRTSLTVSPAKPDFYAGMQLALCPPCSVPSWSNPRSTVGQRTRLCTTSGPRSRISASWRGLHGCAARSVLISACTSTASW